MKYKLTSGKASNSSHVITFGQEMGYCLWRRNYNGEDGQEITLLEKIHFNDSSNVDWALRYTTWTRDANGILPLQKKIST